MNTASPQGLVLSDASIPGLFERIFHSAADALLIIDAEGKIRLANQQAERLFGYDSIGFASLSVEDLVPERFRDNHRRYRAHYSRKPDSRPMGMNLALLASHRDGSEFPVEISLSPFPMGDQALVCANIRDVSELHRARELAVHARQSLAIADFGRMALTIKDVEAIQNEACRLAVQHLDVARAMVVRGERSRSELTMATQIGVDETRKRHIIGLLTPLWNAESAPPDNRPFFLDPDAPARSVGALENTTLAAGTASRLMFCCVPGEEGCVGMLGACAGGNRNFTGDDANFLQALANTIGAVVQRVRTEEKLFQSQRLEALGQLTGGVAHDFNNLLTVVSGNLQMLEERLDDPFSRKLAGAALRATGRGADLTRKLLAFSRRQTLQPRSIDTGQLLSSLAEVLRRTLSAGIQVRTVIEPDLPLVNADAGMLDTALLNLAVNARDAMPNGGMLTFSAQRDRLDADYAARQIEVTPGEYVQISVSDTGSGMSPEVLARAFEPFFTTKESGKGSGLGLSLVYGFIKQSGGHIAAYSEPGLGTTIRLYLPTAEPGARPEKPIDEGEIRGGHETVLVVEDESAVREVAVGFLRRLGYRVLEAGDANTALTLLNAHPGVELLFTDVVLRGEINGPALARQARKKMPDLKVLFTSGYARDALPGKMTIGTEGELLSKPYRIHQLARMLRRALDAPRDAQGNSR